MVEILNREIENFHDIPFIGPWPSKVGKIISLWATPCSPSAEIWVKAFWHDLPWLVWAFIKPETTDLVSERFGTGHHRKRRKRFQIVDRYPPRIPVPKGAVGTAVFPIVQAAERVGWYLLIVDATLDFAINWQSTAYTWEGCGVEDAAWATGRSLSSEMILPSEPDFIVPCWNVTDAYKFHADGNSMDAHAGYDVSCQLSAQANVISGQIQSIKLVDDETGYVYGEGEPTLMPDGKRRFSAQARDWSLTKPRHSFAMRVTSSGPCHVNWEGSFIQLYGNKRKGLKWDP